MAGAVGVVAAFLILVTIAGWSAARLERRWGPPAALALVGFHRLPVVTLLLAAAIGTMVLDERGDHGIRTVAADGATPASVKPGQVFDRWRTANRPERRRGVTPLVFVAASGGGARAAYWTARVLRCVVERQGPPRLCEEAPPPALAQPLFVASGVSGGSLGLASYAAHARSDRAAAPGGAAAADAEPESADWVAERLGDDFLAPTVAWMLFADVPKAIAGVRLGGDRASILEQAWERSWDGDRDSGPLTEGLRASWTDRRLPLLVLNGTDVGRACRVSTSVLDADVDDRDVRLSTAALLSARFPYVSPSGRVALCPGEEAIDVVDGGYIENSGASTALEIWHRVAPKVDRFNANHPHNCIAPVFIQIDNDYVRDRQPGAEGSRRPIEPLVPPRVFSRVRHGNAANARQAAALAFAIRGRRRGRQLWMGEEPVDRYVHLYPSFHPGTKAPLGWALSTPSMKSLDDQLGRHDRNIPALETIQEWFDLEVSCDRAPAKGGGPGR